MATLKKWIGLGLGTALIGSSLAGCGGEGEGGENGEAAVTDEAPSGEQGEGEGEGGESGESGEGEGGEGEAGHSMGDLPVSQRLAFMSGHVEAGLALYRAGEPEMAAPHLLHPVSEGYAEEREGLDALGFTPGIFEQVSQALEEGKPASEVEPLLAQAEANLSAMSAEAGGDPVDIIQYLMTMIAEEYTIGVTDGAITDPGEYQDAYGFAVVALKKAQALSPQLQAEVIPELETLISLWPEPAPVPSETPAPVAQVIAQASRVGLAFSSE